MLRQLDVVIDDLVLWACLVWPPVVALLVALLAGLVRPRARRWWLSAAVGSTVGIAAVAGFVFVVILGIASMLSDPG